MKRILISLAVGAFLLGVGFVGGRLFQHAKNGFHTKIFAEKQYGISTDPVIWSHASESTGTRLLDPGSTIIEYRGRTIYKARRFFQESVPIAGNIRVSDNKIDWDDGELRFHLTVEEMNKDQSGAEE
jgi:hypothetical protein